MMFIGEYHHVSDEKGRLAVPVKFRKDLAKGAVVTKGLDACLFLYPAKEWAALAEKLAKLPLNQANARAFARSMLAGAMAVNLDRQGRILVPEYLRKFAGITKSVVVAGVYNRLELWNEERWSSYKQAADKDSNEIAERLGGLGL